MPTQKPRVMLNLVPDVFRWFRDQELKEGSSKTLIGTAAICALRLLSKEERADMLQWAKLLEDRLSKWGEFEEACEETAKNRQRALKRVLERGLELEMREYREKEAERSGEAGRRGA